MIPALYPGQNSPMRTKARLRTPLQKELARRMKELGLSMRGLSMQANLNEGAVKQIMRGDSESPRHSTVEALAEVLGCTMLDLLQPDRAADDRRRATLRVLGYVDKEQFWPIDGHERGAGLGELEIDLDDPDMITLIVRGDSMRPAYNDGDRVIGSRRRGADTSRCLGRDCIVRLKDGRLLVKVVHKGRRANTFILWSHNVTEPPIEDVMLEWCAPVIWVRRK